MANTVTQKTLHNGTRKVKRQVTVQYVDTATETDVVVFDASTFTGPDGTPPSKASINKVEYDVSAGASVVLEFDASTDVLACAIPEGSGELCYYDVGGLHNTAGAGVTGDVLMSIAGMAAGDVVNLIIEFKLKD